MRRISIHEPAVALTDLAIGIEAALFAVALASERGDATRTGRIAGMRRWFIVFFAATSVAAIAGAALHGLVVDRVGSVRRRLWRISLASIGVAGLSAWCLAAVVALPADTTARITRGLTVVYGSYVVALTRMDPPFRVAIASYLPGAIALAAAVVGRLRLPGERQALVMAMAGLGLTFGAAAAQIRRIAVHPRLFDHNATYHTIQAAAIACFYIAARSFTRPGLGDARSPDPQDAGRR